MRFSSKKSHKHTVQKKACKHPYDTRISLHVLKIFFYNNPSSCNAFTSSINWGIVSFSDRMDGEIRTRSKTFVKRVFTSLSLPNMANRLFQKLFRRCRKLPFTNFVNAFSSNGAGLNGSRLVMVTMAESTLG